MEPQAETLPSENGHTAFAPESSEQSLEQQLESLRAEKATLEGQYGALLGKLTTMRNTLGDKLRHDADELDRREHQISQLQAQNDDLLQALESLKTELIASHEDTDRLQHELTHLRSRALDSQQKMEDENYAREEAYRECREELEAVGNVLEEKRRELMNESVRREQAEARAQSLETVVGSMSREMQSLKEDRDCQAESAENLQSVLQEFQAAKDSEVNSVVRDTQSRLEELESELALYKNRASIAETQLAAAQSDTALCNSMKQELKEKNILIGKIRHEAVILNEHLTEALRRLRRDTAEHSVDRRLVTNVLLSFITTPRADTKRFEMLSLLSSILSWTDEQRQQVGLQKSTGHATRRKGSAARLAKEEDKDTLGDGDTFTDQWVSFLLREANSAEPTSSHVSSPFGSGPSPARALSGGGRKVSGQLPTSPGSSSLSTLSVTTRPASEL